MSSIVCPSTARICLAFSTRIGRTGASLAHGARRPALGGTRPARGRHAHDKAQPRAYRRTRLTRARACRIARPPWRPRATTRTAITRTRPSADTRTSGCGRHRGCRSAHARQNLWPSPRAAVRRLLARVRMRPGAAVTCAAVCGAFLSTLSTRGRALPHVVVSRRIASSASQKRRARLVFALGRLDH